MDTFAGIDIHKSFSQVCVQNQEGETLEQKKLYHDDVESIREFFGALPGEVHVALEATMGWMWLADELQDLGVDVHLCNQVKAKAISESRLKTDSVDARTLSHLLRTGFLPEAYLPSPEVRDQRMLLRYRMALVHMKIRVKNAIHAIMVRYNVGHAYSDLFGRQGREFLKSLSLPHAGKSCVEGWMRLLEFLEGEIARAEKSLYRQFRGSMEVELLSSLPGVGTVLAHLILGEIGNIGQFIRPKKLVRYAGLCPSVRQSAKTVRTGHIGGGRKYLAWALIEAARTASWKDPWLARFYERKKRQKGSGKATVAVARKLAIIVWHILKERRAYKSGNSNHPGSARTSSGGRRRASHLKS